MKERIVQRHVDEDDFYEKEAGFNLSWGSVFAGIVTFIALVVTFSLINAALGFGQFEPTSPNPFEGVGTGQAIWTIVALILSFLGAGFVAGATARRLGFMHGFLTWAGSLIATVILSVWIASAALSAAGSVVGTAADLAGDAVSGIGSGVSQLTDNINIDTDEIDAFNVDVEQILEDTDVEELQPEYLSGQVDQAMADIRQAAQELVVNPENSDQIIQDLTDSLTNRVDNIAENVDEEAVANSIEENTDLTQQEAEEATQNIVDGYQQAAQSAREGIQNVQTQIQETQEEIRVQAEEASDTASQSSIWAFVGVVLGAIISTLAGTLGVNTARRRINEERA